MTILVWDCLIHGLKRYVIALCDLYKGMPSPLPSPLPSRRQPSSLPSPLPSRRQPSSRTISLNNDMTKRSDHGQKKTLILNYLMITDSYMNMIYRLNKVHIVL